VAVTAVPLSRVGILKPLKIRDFALLWTGMTVSLLGDGLYGVAIAWQVYSISNAPTALAVVGIAWMLPQVLLVLVGGVVSDRFERRVVLMVSDAVRGAAIAALGALSITGSLQLWQAVVLVAIYGAGAAAFAPAFTGIVRDVVPSELLVEANSLDQFVRPLCVRIIGPLLGGVIIGLAGAGTAFLADAATFAASAVAFLLMRTRSHPVPSSRSVTREALDGIAYVRSRTWLWATMAAVVVGMFAFFGPVYVLMPYVVKNTLHGGAGGLGLVLAAGGVGAVASALLRGQIGLPPRPLAVVYVAYALTAFSIVGYALAGEVWEAMLVSFVCVGCLTTGVIVWTTVLQQSVPARMIGRVASLDWVLSIGLAPISYAVTALVADALGVRTTLVAAGILGGAAMLLVLALVPSVRSFGAEEVEPVTSTAA
jgi:MFS family permease